MTLTAGTHRTTGQLLTEAEHIAQSIADILSTPLGTRVMREDYGSLVPELIDHPQGAALDLRLAAASYMAIVQWEPRITPSSMTISALSTTGQREITITATRADGPQMGQSVTLRAPLMAGAPA